MELRPDWHALAYAMQDKKHRCYIITALPDTKIDLQGACFSRIWQVEARVLFPPAGAQPCWYTSTLCST